MPSSDPLDPDSAASLLPGEGPVTIERLGTGLVNQTYRVERAGRRYSLRIPAPNAEDLGVDRVWECRVLARAAASGIAPRIERCEPLAGVLVAHWVEGFPLSSEQAREPGNIRAVALLAR